MKAVLHRTKCTILVTLVICDRQEHTLIKSVNNGQSQILEKCHASYFNVSAEVKVC